MSPIIRLLLCSFLAALTTTSYAEVFISSIISTEEKLVHYDVGPRQYVTIPLPNSNTEGDSYILKIVATNKVYKDISAYLVDQTNLELFQKGQTYRGLGHSRTKTPITITGTTNTQGKKYLILDNTYAGFITKKMDVYITASLPIDERKSEAMKASFTHLYDELKRDFIFTDFNIHIEPCGQVNAYSESYTSGDIHICTELLDNVMKSKNPGVLNFIFLHELGHTLLGLWKLPGNNNEDIADEFATYTMLQGGASAGIQLERSLDFWRNRDSAAEAVNMLQNGDRHSLSVQRIRNIKENIENSHEFCTRWSQLLYPHMTTPALENIIKQPSENSNIALAKAILNERRETVTQKVGNTNNDMSAQSIAQRLKRLDDLHKEGILTQEEYQSKRENILSDL